MAYEYRTVSYTHLYYMVTRNDSLWKTLDWVTIFIYLLLIVGGWFSVCGASYDLSLIHIFFLAYANVWAGNIRPEEILRLTKLDPHSLGKWRVDGALPHIQNLSLIHIYHYIPSIH